MLARASPAEVRAELLCWSGVVPEDEPQGVADGLANPRCGSFERIAQVVQALVFHRTRSLRRRRVRHAPSHTEQSPGSRTVTAKRNIAGASAGPIDKNEGGSVSRKFGP